MEAAPQPAPPPAALLVVTGQIRDLQSGAQAMAALREQARPRPSAPPPPLPPAAPPRRRAVTLGPLRILRA